MRATALSYWFASMIDQKGKKSVRQAGRSHQADVITRLQFQPIDRAFFQPWHDLSAL